MRRPKIHLSTQKKHIIRLKQNHITACHLLIQALIDDRCGSFASTSSKTGKLTRFRTSEKQHKSVMKKMTHVEGHRVRKSCGADTALHRHATKGDPLRRSSSARDRESERERESSGTAMAMEVDTHSAHHFMKLPLCAPSPSPVP